MTDAELEYKLNLECLDELLRDFDEWLEQGDPFLSDIDEVLKTE